MKQFINRLPQVGMFITLGLWSPLSKAVTWDAQAERLQKVSASFLDAQPLLSTTNGAEGSIRIEGKAVVSALPKMNATVGAKTEQPPQPPAHSIPTVEIGYASKTSSIGQGLLRVWGGFLPENAGKSIGMSASVGQRIIGFSLGIKNEDVGPVSTRLELGQQYNSTEVKGGITEPKAKDVFRVKTKLQFAALTVTPEALPKGWVQAQISERKVSTYFEIPSDGTVFNLTDSSLVKAGSASTQFSIGYDIAYGLQAAVAYLNTPQRSTMPRVLLSYSRSFGGDSKIVAANQPTH